MKNHRTQHTPLNMIETWKAKLNMGHKVGVIYMNLSKAFDSLNHELLIAKLKCYGLDQNAVECFRSYHSNHYHCCKINNTFGDWRKTIAGVPQGSKPGFYYSTYFKKISFSLYKTLILVTLIYCKLNTCYQDLETLISSWHSRDNERYLAERNHPRSHTTSVLATNMSRSYCGNWKLRFQVTFFSADATENPIFQTALLYLKVNSDILG